MTPDLYCWSVQSGTDGFVWPVGWDVTADICWTANLEPFLLIMFGHVQDLPHHVYTKFTNRSDILPFSWYKLLPHSRTFVIHFRSMIDTHFTSMFAAYP